MSVSLQHKSSAILLSTEQIISIPTRSETLFWAEVAPTEAKNGPSVDETVEVMSVGPAALLCWVTLSSLVYIL